MKLLKNVIVSFTLISLLHTNLVFAESIQVKKGEPAKYDGTLMDEKTSQYVRDELIEKDALVKINESQEKQINLYRKNEIIYIDQKDMLLKQNIELTKTLNSTRQTSTIEKIGLILLGIGLTVGAGYAVGKVAR